MLRIKDWNVHYENNRTRILKRLDWVPIPNRMDGLGYIRLMDHAEGAAHFGAWVALIELASKSDPRGDLGRDGSPLTVDVLSILTRIPERIFLDAIPRLLKIGWLEGEISKAESQSGTQVPDSGTQVPDERHSGRHTGAHTERQTTRQTEAHTDTSTKEGKKEGKKEKSGPAFDIFAACERFTRMYPVNVGNEAAIQWYVSELSRTDNPAELESLVIAGLQRHLGSEKWWDPKANNYAYRFIPSQAKFLGRPMKQGDVPQKMYLDHPPQRNQRMRDEDDPGYLPQYKLPMQEESEDAI